MKATAIFSLLALGATSVSAAAVAKHHKGFCSLPGQPCWKVKRTAEAFAEAIASFGGPAADSDSALSRRSHADGGAANLAMRSLDGLATIVASTQSEPRSFYTDLQLTSRFPEPIALTGEELAARDVDAEKREAEAEPEAKHFCPLKFESCWKAKREAEADPEAKNFCSLPGQSCWKAKRAAEAIISSIDDSSSSVAKREAEAKFCPLKHESCWKQKREAEAGCNAAGGSCAAATRDLTAMYHAARQVLDLLPSQ
ncbi:hypothetical protein SEPCBS57363_004541 [Sporothrix epigloea]|uniref:Clock-controlled pheromone ccg-4 n=1 Tax=Sporothrix epigloea TaxID=1892477 RepID=A0ABP0DSK2_9PEZI